MSAQMLRNAEPEDCRLRNEAGEQKYLRSQSVVSRVIAGETLIVPVRGKVGDLASIYSFNQPGSLIWKLLQAPKSLVELAAAVAQEYVVSQERAQLDAAKFLSEMLLAGLVEVSRQSRGGD
jgi:hypothetical protein